MAEVQEGSTYGDLGLRASEVTIITRVPSWRDDGNGRLCEHGASRTHAFRAPNSGDRASMDNSLLSALATQQPTQAQLHAQ